MPASCPISNLTPEQVVAVKRIAIVYFTVKMLNIVGMLAMALVMLTTEFLSPQAAWFILLGLVLFSLVAGRLCMARSTQIQTGAWPKRSAAGWLWDLLLVTMLATLLAMTWQ